MLWRLTRLFDRLERYVTAVTAAMMALLAVFVGYQVFARYVLRSSPFWIEELSVTLMMWIGLLGAAGCVWTESHMGLELIRSRLPAAARCWFSFATDCLVALFSLFLFGQGLLLVRSLMSATLATLSIPLGYTFLMVPIAGILMAVFALTKAIGRVLTFYAGREAKTQCLKPPF